jgi:hypothetical protein
MIAINTSRIISAVTIMMRKGRVKPEAFAGGLLLLGDGA